MNRDGWRQCAIGQKTTQFCGLLEAAVAAEREACAKICEKYQLDFVARDIRKRGEPDASTALQSIQQQ